MINSISIRHIVLIKLMLGTAFASDLLEDSLPVPPSTSSTPAPTSGSSDTSSSSSSGSQSQNKFLAQPHAIHREEASYLSRSDLSSLAQTSTSLKKLVDEELPKNLNNETWVLDFSNAQVREKIDVLRRDIKRVGVKLKVENATLANIEELIRSGILARVVSLDAGGLELGNLSIMNLVIASPNLVSLNISNTDLTADGIGTLAEALRVRTQLQKLDISSNYQLGNEGVAAVVNAFSHLVSLDISGTGLTADGIEPVAKTIANARLKNLNIRGNFQLGIGAAAIVNSSPHLVSLNISNIGLTADGIETLAEALSRLIQLQELDMPFNQLGNRGVAAVINASPHLVSLDIENTGITAEGIETLGIAFRNLTQLQKLFLGGMSTTIEGLDDYLANACPHLLMLNGRKFIPKKPLMSTTTTTSTPTTTVPHSDSLMEVLD